MKPLYEIANEYQLMLDEQVTEDGEIKDLAIFQGGLDKFNDKAIAVASYINNLDAYINAIDEAEKKMKARKDSLKKRYDYLKDYLKSNMQACDIKEIECPYFELKLAKNPVSVNILDEVSIPNIYRNVKTVETIDKTAIKKAIEAGADVPGARLENGVRLVIK